MAVVLAFTVIGCALTAHPITAHALPRRGHDNYISKVLFSSADYNKLTPKHMEKLALLEAAVHLCIDQAGNVTTTFDELKGKGIYRFPTTLAEINCPGSYSHRQYTHRGWSFPYTDCDSKKEGWSTTIWPKRQRILLATTEKVFRFTIWHDAIDYNLNYAGKCQYFSAFLYYIHILSDHTLFTAETYRKEHQYIIPISGELPTNCHIVQLPYDQASIISELIYYSYQLFGEDAWYLIDELRVVNNRFEQLPANTVDRRKVFTAEAFPTYTELAKRLIEEQLPNYIPELLREQTWWKNVFLKK